MKILTEKTFQNYFSQKSKNLNILNYFDKEIKLTQNEVGSAN